jgi:hypothetical protein
MILRFLALFKVFILLISLMLTAKYVFPPLRIIFTNRILYYGLFAFLLRIYTLSINQQLNLNGIPIIGNLFIGIDYVFIHYIFPLIKKKN